MTSSPGLPSPCSLLLGIAPRPIAVSKSTSAPIDAVAEFTSASTLLSQGQQLGKTSILFNFFEPHISKNKSLQDQKTDPATSRYSETQKLTTFKKPKPPRKKQSKPAQKEAESTPLTNSVGQLANMDTPASRKIYKKKSDGEGDAQTKIKKVTITKPGATSASTKAKKSTAGKVEKLDLPNQENSTTQGDLHDLCLEMATSRKKNWTPSKDTFGNHADILGHPSENLPCQDIQKTNLPPSAQFGRLLGEYGFTQNSSDFCIDHEAASYSNDNVTVKKRKIELIKGVFAPSQAERPKRQRSPKKKLQTITGKATAPFMPIATSSSPSLLEYFAASGSPVEDAGIGHLSATESCKPPAKRSTKKRPANPKAKDLPRERPILLSPESAMKTAGDQELIFGTSSQLVCEDSPTFLKDLQQAMKASDSIEDSSPENVGTAISGPSKASCSLALSPSKNLWSVAARAVDGSLLSAEVVNLADTPRLSSVSVPTRDVPIRLPNGTSESQRQLSDDTGMWQNIDHDSNPQKANSNVEPVLLEGSLENETSIPRSVAEASLRIRPKSRSPIKKASVPEVALDQMPNYVGFTDVQLSKQVTSYGFKVIKKREVMIDILEQCWKSRKSMVLQEIPSKANISQAMTNDANGEMTRTGSPSKKRGRPPKIPTNPKVRANEASNGVIAKARGRPKKDSKAVTASSTKQKRKKTSPTKTDGERLTADEIYDSKPPTPSPPHRRSLPKPRQQLPLSQPQARGASRMTTASEDREFLFSGITKAVTAPTPSHDLKNLTWHEKMLIYDPIVIEDLAAWLNAEGLDTVGVDDEVSPDQVKEWCEERSVCSMWKENLRGGSRGRY